jgi:hypothetical protein
MKTIRWHLIPLLLALAGASYAAGDSPRNQIPYKLGEGPSSVLSGEALGLAKTEVDTIYLMGGPNRPDGNFQNDDYPAFPETEGWYGVDLTQRTDPIWHISTFNAELLDESHTPNRAMWCGEYFLPCSGEPENPGYGNDYNEYLDWYGIVPNSLGATTIRVQARLNYDNEPGYDFLYLEVERVTGMDVVQSWNGDNRQGGVFVPVDVDETFSVTPPDYVGSNHDQVHLRWHFESDSGWSDQDCSWPTDGAAQVDNITVSFNGTPWAFDDFEPGSWVNWQVEYPTGVGQYAWTWPALEDADACNSDWSPQWAFIDNGLVLPGTGGYSCISWCYGPSGYIVNPEGGLAGPDFHLHNEVWSPYITWPETGYDGAAIAFDVYRHEPLVESVSPGMFYVWHVRSTTDPTGSGGWSGWVDRNFVYYGGPDYFRQAEDVSDLLVPGRRLVQLALGAYELGWIWGYEGIDGTPAPFFDNAMLLGYEHLGPAITTREIDIAQDNFPEIGALDPNDLGANHVRFDMAQSIALPAEMKNQPGDSIVFDITAVRAGAAMVGKPQLCYHLKANPLFDSARTSGLPNVGCVDGDSVFNAAGIAIADRWAFDLPDTGFFFPGDVIHYYLRATDQVGGVTATTRLPGDTTGFSLFPGDAGYMPLRFPVTFVVRALPTITTPAFDQVPVLFWNDFGNRGGLPFWTYSMSQLGFVEGVDFDIYHTNGPSSGVGNGLGGRATATQLLGYETMIYSSGDLAAFTISNGDFENDPGNDVGVLDSWLRNGNKKMFITGDDVAFDLNQSGAATLSFLNTWISVDLVQQDVRPLIDGQANPLVTPVDGNPVFNFATAWLANAACPILNTFDAVLPIGNAVAVAQFMESSGAKSYSYPAAVLNYDATYNNTILFLPYDFMAISTPYGTQKSPPNSPERTRLLEDVMLYLGYSPGAPLVGVPEARSLEVSSYPNPFNPITRIAYSMPQRGHLKIRVFNVRGELVRTLIDQVVDQGAGHVEWDGKDDHGDDVASGVYFCETRALQQRRVQKMALVK